jgi:protein-L-isoaspartate(D-aspartate) O-methyltransferase
MDYKIARKHMVDSQVRPNDVPDLSLQLAMEETQRENFVPSSQKSMAYSEMDIPLFEGRVLLKARDFSKLLHAANISADDLVLDLGCGYGYSSAILANMADMVIAVEESDEMVAKAEEALAPLKKDNIVVFKADLSEGLAKQGPYNAIVIAGGAVETKPEKLLGQLADGGRLVCLQQTWAGMCEAVVYIRSEDGIGQRAVFEAGDVKTLPSFTKAKEFVF